MKEETLDIPKTKNSFCFSEVDSGPGPRVVVDAVQQEISFCRADKGLGLSIAGGLGSTPYKEQ